MSEPEGGGEIRVLVVDDEPVARSYLKTLIGKQTDLTLVGECRNGREARRAILETAPDVVFLDIAMPGLDGFEVLAGLDCELPAVVFVTAHAEFAVRAFEVHALDYLLKPFDSVRFEETLTQVRRHLDGRWAGEIRQSLRALLATMVETARPVYLERIAVRDKEETQIIRVEEIDWIEAESNYIILHRDGATHLVRYALGTLEKELDPRRFVRIHRGTIVNVDRIESLSPVSHGDYRVHLADGTELNLSRRYRDRLRASLRELG